MAAEVESVRNFLKSQRGDIGSSLAAFAERLGVSEGDVLKIESGQVEAPAKYMTQLSL
jgi:transcriptional regulator with XRE-family HTH domain